MALDYANLNWSHYRELTGLSIHHVSDQTGIHKTTLVAIEIGTYTPQIEDKKKLLDLYEGILKDQIDQLEKKVNRLKMSLPAFDICRKAISK